MNSLIIGGTSGLGLELARKFSEEGEVIVTGRHDPEVDFAEYREFDLAQENLTESIDKLISDAPKIDRFVYAAGYYQEGRITDLSNEEIEAMMNVGARALVYFVKAILDKQDGFDELITITSTSQWTPRKLEPVYNYAKAAAGHFSNSIAEDGRVKKVLVAGPAGMDTPFWEGIERDDLDTMMKPEWVAEQIVELEKEDYKYRFARILRQPQRVEVVETR